MHVDEIQTFLSLIKKLQEQAYPSHKRNSTKLNEPVIIP